MACYDHAPERQWRHLNTCQFHTLVHARVPRVQCPEHGVVQVKVPWAEPHGRFTLLMERFVIDVLQACQTVKGACSLVGISWDQAWHVLERAVDRGLARKDAGTIARIGIDCGRSVSRAGLVGSSLNGAAGRCGADSSRSRQWPA